MRNKYTGSCYYCGSTVKVGEGHFERNAGSWRTIHADCVFKLRQKKQAKDARWVDISGNGSKGAEIAGKM